MMKKVKHTILLLFIIAVVSACSNSSNETDTISLDLSHFFPPSSFIEEELQAFIEEVHDKSDGTIDITSYPGATLAEPEEHFDAAQTGSVDIALSVHGYTPNQFPLTSIMELPFLSSNSLEGSEKLWEIFNDYDEFQDEYAGTVPLWLYTTDPGHIHTTKKQIKSVDDLKGMRIRSPSPEASEWLEALGATPVSMPMNETFEALERGVVDGTVASWEAVKVWGLDEVIQYSTVGSFYTTTMFVVMNEDTFNQLDDDQQEVLLEVAGENMVNNIGNAFDEISEESKEDAESLGIEVYELTEDDLEEWLPYIQPTIDKKIEEIESDGLPAEEIYEKAQN